MNEFHCGITLENFRPDEFICPCCGVEKMHRDTLEKLQRLRTLYGRAIRIVEGGGYRCPVYHTAEHSAHQEGRAVDLGIGREDYYAIVGLAQLQNFTGIGIKNHGGRWQIHLDDAVNLPGIRPRPWVWTYA